ncbi:MAG: hypothetical protein HY690_04310 [Chloroflexi bacterium]|nr:hypothetical protein [Chloroflexota bacterium]
MGTSPREVLADYVRHVNQLLNRTVTHSRLQLIHAPGDPTRAVIARIQDGVLLPLELGPDAWLDVQQELQVDVAAETVLLLSYRYVYGRGPNSKDEQAWIFRYEYERKVQPGYPYSPAHLHINVEGLSAQVGSKTFKKLHFPTGRVSLEQVLTHLIIEFGVEVLGEAQHPEARGRALALLRESLARGAERLPEG